MNSYETQQINNINSIIGFATSIMIIGFMMGMVKSATKGLLGDNPNNEPDILIGKYTSWLAAAWDKLLVYAEENNLEEFKGVFERAEKKKWSTARELPELKMVLAGYYLIATEQATDQVVNNVFRIIKTRSKLVGGQFKEMTDYTPMEFLSLPIEKQNEIEEDFEGPIISIAKAYRMVILEPTKTRADKIIAIDTVIAVPFEFTHAWTGTYLSWLFPDFLETSVDEQVANFLEVLSEKGYR